MQRYAVWFGGSMLSSTPEFYKVSSARASAWSSHRSPAQVCHKKSEYDEKGPGIARHNA